LSSKNEDGCLEKDIPNDFLNKNILFEINSVCDGFVPLNFSKKSKMNLENDIDKEIFNENNNDNNLSLTEILFKKKKKKIKCI